MKILVTPTSMASGTSSEAMQRLFAFVGEVVFNPKGAPLTEDELIPLLQNCDGYIAGLDQVSEKVLRACPKLKVVSRYGVGCDAVDLAAAKELGITITNTPGVNAQGVAELALALMLSVARKIPYLDRETKAGNWVRSTGIELGGRTVGILGLGAIGKRLASYCKGLGMKVAAYDPYIDLNYCEEHQILPLSLESLLQTSDIISLHLPLNEKTRHIIHAGTIARMKDGAILINASRGAIVDEAAAYEALLTGKLGGLGLDAFEAEPPTGSKLLKLENVVATPHTGAHTEEAVRNMQSLSVQNLIDVLSGNPCRFVVC